MGLRNNKHVQRRKRPVRYHGMKFRYNDIMLHSPSSISSFLICGLEYFSDLWHLMKQRPTVLLLLFPFSENILVLTASHLSSLAIPEFRTTQQNWGGGEILLKKHPPALLPAPLLTSHPSPSQNLNHHPSSLRICLYRPVVIRHNVGYNMSLCY